MFDTELFILQIEEKPSIWDVRDSDYKNNVKKASDWNEVAAEMIPHWSSLNKQGQELKGQELMKKWKNIKDKYRKALKEVRQVKSGSSAKKVKKTYAYFDLLHFMQPVLEKKIKKEEDKNQNEDVSETKNVTSPIIEQTVRTPLVHEQNQAKRKKKDQNDQEVLTIVKERNSLEEKRSQDEDVLFVMSLVPRLKEMTPAMNLRTKIEILTTMGNNLYGVVGDSPTATTSRANFTAPASSSSSRSTTAVATKTNTPTST